MSDLLPKRVKVMKAEQKKGEHGQVLPIALMLVVLLTMLTPALLFLSSNGFFNSKQNSQSQQARFLADAAYQAALQIIYRTAKTADTTPPFPLNVTNESDLINQIRQIRSSADTTDNGSYQVTDLPGYINPEIRNGQRIYYLQAQGTAGTVVSTIKFTLLFAQDVSQIIVPSDSSFPNPPDNVKDLIVYDPNARQYAENQLSAALRSAAYTPNVTCTSCTTQRAIDSTIQSNLNYDPLVIRVRTLSLSNNAALQFKRPDGKRLVIMADQISVGNNASLIVQGTLISEKTVSLDNNSKLDVAGDFIIKSGDLQLANNSECTVSGQLAVDSEIKQENQSMLTVSGLLAASQMQIQNNGTLNALGGASIVDTLVVRNNAGSIFNNQLIVGKMITLQNNAFLRPGSGSGEGNVSFVGVQKL